MIKDSYEVFSQYINNWCNTVCKDNKDKGFWDSGIEERLNMYEEDDDLYKELVDEYNILNMLAKISLMHSELSEATEAVRKGSMDDKLINRSGLEVELADTVIRIMDFCGHYKIDLGGAIIDKLEYNKTRPYKHGKKC